MIKLTDILKEGQFDFHYQLLKSYDDLYKYEPEEILDFYVDNEIVQNSDMVGVRDDVDINFLVRWDA